MICCGGSQVIITSFENRGNDPLLPTPNDAFGYYSLYSRKPEETERSEQSSLDGLRP